MTAVEWLFEHLEGIRIIDGYEWIKLREAFEQAKQMEKEQIEISDEEIEKQAIKYDNQAFSETPIAHFIEGAKWYREQLKNK